MTVASAGDLTARRGRDGGFKGGFSEAGHVAYFVAQIYVSLESS